MFFVDFSREMIFDNKYPEFSLKLISWLFAFIAVSTVAGFSPLFLTRLYIPAIILCLFYLILGGIGHINIRYILMYFFFGLSALFASEPLFDSKIRVLLFYGVTLLCSAGFSSYRACVFRSLIFRNIIILLSILTVGSFFSYFLGINFMKTYGTDMVVDVTKAGRFGGLYAHSMLLGPLSVLVALAFMHSFMTSRKKLYILLFFLSAAAVVMSASRAAVLALGVATIFVLLFMKDTNGGRGRLIGLLLGVFLIAIPIFDEFSSGLIEKQQSNVEAGGSLNSREDKWNNRIQEFYSNPIFGVGFCAVDIKNTEDYNELGGVEPGSTHLSVLSMTGIMGFFAYLLVLLQALKNVMRADNPIAQFRLSILIAMLVHAIFEGYALYAGGLLCLVYWLSIGVCIDFKKNELYVK